MLKLNTTYAAIFLELDTRKTAIFLLTYHAKFTFSRPSDLLYYRYAIQLSHVILSCCNFIRPEPPEVQQTVE